MTLAPCLRGVDVAVDVQAVLRGVFAGEPAGYLLLGFDRAHAAFGDVVRGPDPGVAGEPQDVVLAAGAEFQQVTAGVLGGGVLRPGDAGHVGEPGEDGMAELVDQRVTDVRGDLGLAGITGGVPGADQPAAPAGPASARSRQGNFRLCPGCPASSTTPDPHGRYRRVRVTHPFHPLAGRDFEFVAYRQNWGEDRVHLHDENGQLFSLPAAWTDVAVPDPFVVVAAGRCPFTTAGLLALADLVGRFRGRRYDGRDVKAIMP